MWGRGLYNKAMRLHLPRPLLPALAGAIAMPALAFFFATALLLQFTRVDLDWMAAPISFYLLGPDSGWLVAAYFALALALLLVGLGLHFALAPAARRVLAPVLFAVSAAGVAVVALAHTDTALDPAPTARGFLHNLAAALAFLSACVAMLLQSWAFRRDPRWRPHFRAGFVLAAAAFAALWLYALWGALPRGGAQKSVILLIVLWLLLACRWLMRMRPKA